MGTGRRLAFGLAVAAAGPAAAQEIGQGYGPQTPRDISATAGENLRVFTLAPEATRMNLRNIHFHVNAEHKGPGF
jgi:hypothetical protein